MEDSSRCLFICTNYSEGEGLSLEVSDGENSWLGTLTKEQLVKMADQSKMSPAIYIEDSLKALTRKKLGSDYFVYSAKGTGESLDLSWKRYFMSDNVKFQLGTVKLEPGCSQIINSSFLNHAMDTTEELWQKISELETESTRLARERQAAISRLDGCATLQEDIEKDLYGKFKLVLNEKKAKIRKLMELNHHLTEINEDMKRQNWDLKSGRVTASSKSMERKSSEVESRETSPEEPGQPDVARTTVHVESLLGGDSSRANRGTSPPLAKRHRQDRGRRRVKEIPHPPPLLTANSRSVSASNRVQAKKGDDTENSMDSVELLDML